MAGSLGMIIAFTAHRIEVSEAFSCFVKWCIAISSMILKLFFNCATMVLAAGVLRIDCANNTASMIGPNYGVGKYFWHGGIKRNGKIYAHPSHANTVLVIDTTKVGSPTVSELRIHRAVYDTDSTNRTYKWLGGAGKFRV
jgi:hypothetical protein